MKKLFVLLLLCMALGTNVHAASNVTISRNNQKTTFGGAINQVYINNKKVSLSSTPIFLKDNTYVGPAYDIFKNSELKVKSTAMTNKNTITMTYNGKSIVLKDAHWYCTVGGKSYKMGTCPMFITYTSSKKDRWAVPLNSVCTRLGISYKRSNGNIYISGPANKETATTQTKPATTQTKPTTTATTQTKPATTQTKTTTAKTADPAIVVIDAGHGGADSGATGNGLKEKDMTLKIVKEAKKYFDKDSRFKVYYTRTTDTYPSLSARYTLANNKKADMFLCVHINSADNTSARGTETLYAPGRNASTKNKKYNLTNTKLAQIMHKHTLKATGFTNRGLVNRPNLAVLKNTKMPACLIEYGFISNKTEAGIMKGSYAKYGKSLYDGACEIIK